MKQSGTCARTLCSWHSLRTSACSHSRSVQFLNDSSESLARSLRTEGSLHSSSKKKCYFIRVSSETSTRTLEITLSKFLSTVII